MAPEDYSMLCKSPLDRDLSSVVKTHSVIMLVL